MFAIECPALVMYWLLSTKSSEAQSMEGLAGTKALWHCSPVYEQAGKTQG